MKWPQAFCLLYQALSYIVPDQLHLNQQALLEHLTVVFPIP